MAPTDPIASDIAGELALLERGGIARSAAQAWLRAWPKLGRDFRRDAAACTRFWRTGARLRATLPPKPKRSVEQAAAAAAVFRRERELRERFLAAHAVTIYERLTNRRRSFLRAERLVHDAAALVPGLTPSPATLREEAERPLKDKDGAEIDQGIFLAHVLAHPVCGAHLCHAMLLPRPQSLELQARLARDGSVELEAAAVTRADKASVVEMRRPRFLNAMDHEWLHALETAVDLVILDPETEIAVLRGGRVDRSRYRGRRVFSAGINLTLLYQGQIPFLFYLDHLMGFEHKIFRGLARPDAPIDDMAGATIEKPWIAVVDGFAIGGGCQHLLVMDYVLAATDAYLTLPARKEGIMPGAANLRLPRFLGDRLSRQAIMGERRFACDSVEGRLICDEVVPPDRMDEALAVAIARLTGSGVVSAVSNRRALRIVEEPLDLFRRYLALYAREQAYCHFSPALIANLERHWDAAQRRT
jgi:thioesterase DpgC